MLISLEDYRNRRRQLRARVEALRVAAGGGRAAAAIAPATIRTAAPLHAMSLAAFADPAMPPASDLAALFADASLI